MPEEKLVLRGNARATTSVLSKILLFLDVNKKPASRVEIQNYTGLRKKYILDGLAWLVAHKLVIRRRLHGDKITFEAKRKI